jgi:hypothetical protein
MENLKQNQYPAWIKAYDAVVALGLVNDSSDTVNFPINSDSAEYIKTSHSFGEIVRKAFEELNAARMSGDEIRELEKEVRSGGSVGGVTLGIIQKLKQVQK